jgi:PAS domain S-box-containing protein
MEPGSTILIVDDEPFGRKTLGALLNDPGYSLAFASNGSEALTKAIDLTPDLILLDVMMPDMDGFEVCRRLRADARLAEVPVIMVTALDDRTSRLQGIEAGADDLVSKPFDPVELTTRVRTITRLNRYRRLLIERAKFERMTELAPDGILIVDAQGIILLVNPALLHMLGVEDATMLLGRNLRTIIAPEYGSQSAAWLQRIISNSGDVSRVETALVRLDGIPFPVEVNAGHVMWDNILAIQIIVRDITERKRAEEALRQSENHLRRSRDALRALFDGLDDSLLLLDSIGKILAVNQAMSSLLGENQENLVGQYWKTLCLHPNHAFPGKSALKTLHDGRARRYREHYTGSNGQTRVLDIQTLPLIGPETPVDQVIVHVVDVTERLQVEALAIQNEHFAARGRMAASIAHEVNTPLQSIQNCLYLAEKASTTQRTTYLGLAREELDRISTIVRQLLDLQQPDENHSPTHINLNALVERVLLLTGGILANHGIDVERELVEDPPLLLGHADHLTQVLLNIILNAVDAMPDGGKLHIQTLVQPTDEPMLPSETPRNTHSPTSTMEHSMFVMKIRDNGYGIPHDIQSRMFDPFFTTKESGSGVGLAISQRIIRQHGGKINVQSTPGQGSTFTIHLPLQKG